MSEIINDDVKPANLNINLNIFCKECNVFKPEIETTDYTINTLGNPYFKIESYVLTCKHMPACLKYNI